MATDTRGFDALLGAFDRFYTTLEATTILVEGGGRQVLDGYCDIALSEATDALFRETGLTHMRLVNQHGRPVIGFPPGCALLESDSPDGPWNPIPPDAVKGWMLNVGDGGADAVLMAALTNMRVVAFPIEKWNAMQAARPGANHKRFHAGDIVSAHDLSVLESVSKLLRMRAPSAPIVAPVSGPKRRSRKRPIGRQERPLTPIETNTLQVVARHQQNFAAAAAELGRDAKTVRENYQRAMEKMNRLGGRQSRSVGTSVLPTDRRGQPNA